MSAPVPLDDLPRDLDALHALHDDLGERIDALSDRRWAIAVRISGIENGDDEWGAYRDCVSGDWHRAAR